MMLEKEESSENSRKEDQDGYSMMQECDEYSRDSTMPNLFGNFIHSQIHQHHHTNVKAEARE